METVMQLETYDLISIMEKQWDESHNLNTVIRSHKFLDEIAEQKGWQSCPLQVDRFDRLQRVVFEKQP